MGDIETGSSESVRQNGWCLINRVTNSPTRIEILVSLDETPIGMRDLRDELEMPRTTVHRNVSLSYRKTVW